MIGGYGPSTIGRDLMPHLGPKQVQVAASEVMNIQGSSVQPDKPLDDWHLHFSKQFSKLFNRVGRMRNY